MKTTIDIPDSLLLSTRQTARKRGITLRALVEEGLRLVVPQRSTAVFKKRVSEGSLSANQTENTIPTNITAHLSEPALAADWNRPEEDAAWTPLQKAR